MDQKSKSSFIAKQKRKHQYQLLLVVIGFIFIVLGSLWIHVQSDWTTDKRYSITPTTKTLLKEVKQPIHIEVFLAGDDLPAAFKRLSKSAEVLLSQFRSISNNNITYSIIDPLDDSSEEALQKLNHFKMSGIPVTIDAGKKGTAQRMVFPWALVAMQNQEGEVQYRPVFLQETNTPNLSRAILNKSEILLEYNFAQAIDDLTETEKAGVGYLTGNGQPFGYELIGLLGEIGQYYHLDTLNLQSTVQIPKDYKTIVVNQPTEEFSEVDKFKLDQYLMHGGQIVWNVNGVTGNLDSLQMTGQYNSMPVDLNLSDLFFHYGFRVNQVIVVDALNHVMIPLAPQGFEQAEHAMFPWIYYPILETNKEHPMGQQITGVLGRFVSSIDFNENDPNIIKTPILVSSRYTKAIAVPAPVQLESAMEQLNEAQYNMGVQTVGALFEGRMQSFYSRRQPQEVQDFIAQHQLQIKSSSDVDNKMFVAADGSLFLNAFSEQNGPSEMGIFRYSDFRFDNKVLLNNIMTYFNRGEQLIGARSKNFDIRLLDPQTVKKDRTKMQWLNIAVPILVYIIFAGVWFFIRKRKYS